MKKFLTKVISTRTLVIFFLLLEVILFVIGILLLTDYFAEVRTVLSILAIIVALFVFNSKCNSAYKLMWLLFIIIVPIFGSLCYILFANKKFTRNEIRKLRPLLNALSKANDNPKNRNIADKIDPIKDPNASFFGKYLNYYSLNGIYENSEVTYYPWGEDAWKVMLEKLEKAKHYIFLEYFIIQEGKMWDPMLEILKRKASEGIDVRIMYDDLGCLHTLRPHYFRELEKFGIQAIAVNRIRPLFDIRMNNRDHRKIMVIDGHTGFTGGINLADEYINEKERFGKWKDNAIMIRGDAVFGLTTLFLSTWISLVEKNTKSKYKKGYRVDDYINEIDEPIKSSGYVAPYGSLPFTYETIGENVYLDLILKAQKYVYITTPYLILDEQLNNAIMNAAKGGVKIRLVTPHIPDKKTVFDLTRSYYRDLVEAGVEIYEYTPGFIHMKTFLVDGEMATVGTINLDYRSLFLHMENSCFLYKCDCLKEIEKDFDKIFAESRQITLQMIKSAPVYKRLFRFFLKFFSPAM